MVTSCDEDFGLLGCDATSHPRRAEFRNHEEVGRSKEQHIRMAMSVDSWEFREECQKFLLRKTMSHLKHPCICGTQIPITVVASPNMCWISATERRVSCDRRGTLGLWQRGGGVRHVSMSSSLSTLWGTSSPTSKRSVESSSMPRPSHRPQGNL